MRTACCPGTYDPVTNGHLDVVARTAACFDRVIVAVLHNPAKQPLLALEERVELLRGATASIAGVEVATFSGLLVDFARARGVTAIVKGLRAAGDFTYERQMAQMNRRIAGVETLFVASDPLYSYVSSSLVKEVALRGGDVGGLVPEAVAARLSALAAGGHGADS